MEVIPDQGTDFAGHKITLEAPENLRFQSQ